MTPEKIITVGRFGKPFGLKGFLKVQSFTDPAENLFAYPHWYLQNHQQWTILPTLIRQHQGKEMIVKLPDCESPEAARVYTNKLIGIPRSDLPPPQANEYYWVDLEGLEVFDAHKQFLGLVSRVFGTGANDVLEVKNNDRTILIPFIKSAILEVDFSKSMIRVDWEEL
jgi:16S rRNA processing protein RimM